MDRKVIALDIGQVCVQVRGELCFAKLGYRSAAEVPRELFVLNDEMEKGRLTADEYFERFRELTGSELDKEAMLEAFCSIIAAPVPGMSELVARLPEQGIRPVFFSNTSCLHLERVRQIFAGAAAVPEGVYSFEVGAMKPESAIYEAFEQRYGRPALYVDDRPDLIAAARERGWEAHCFNGAADLEKTLRNRLLVHCN